MFATNAIVLPSARFLETSGIQYTYYNTLSEHSMLLTYKNATADVNIRIRYSSLNECLAIHTRV